MGMLNDTIAPGGLDKGYTAQLLADGRTGSRPAGRTRLP